MHLSFHQLIILSPLYAATLFVTPNPAMQAVNSLFSAVKSMQKVLADDIATAVDFSIQVQMKQWIKCDLLLEVVFSQSTSFHEFL